MLGVHKRNRRDERESAHPHARMSENNPTLTTHDNKFPPEDMAKRLLAAEELAALVKVRGRERTFDGDANLFLLGAEAERIRIAHQLIKELLFRGVLQKVLIITPGGLTKQWVEDELQEKFGLYPRLVNRASFHADPGQFSRYEEGIFVTSIDFLARNEGCLKAASQTQWDLVVVDEAHKLSAYEYGAKLEESERYKAVKSLAHKTDHLLFLTATPHRGRKDTFRRLLLLLDEDLFQKDEQVANPVRAQPA
jgi:SNF2 family DNA or RNA helicase